jgi:hypothetical protein
MGMHLTRVRDERSCSDHLCYGHPEKRQYGLVNEAEPEPVALEKVNVPVTIPASAANGVRVVTSG